MALIFVIGATGKVRRVVSGLLERSANVRALPT